MEEKEMCAIEVNVDIDSRVCNDEIGYKCSECGKAYQNIRDLVSHQGTHTGEYPYICEYCHKGYKCKTNLVNHINLHTGEGYPCQECKKVFSSAFLLKQHKRSHVKEKLFACKICGKAFKLVEMLRSHSKQAHSDKLYPCSLCAKKLCSQRSLDAHLKAHDLKKLTCPYCSLPFKYYRSLTKHLVKHDATNENLFHCLDCDERFLYEKALKHHAARYHSPVMKHQCIYCDLQMESKEALDSHIERHKQVEPAPCQFCGGPLRRKHGHKSWARQKLLRCPRCQAVFHFPSMLLEHVRVHGDDPAQFRWSCDVCGCYFVCHHEYSKHVSKPHELTLGTVNTFVCGSCQKNCESIDQLKEHIKVHLDHISSNNLRVDLFCHDCGILCRSLGTFNRHRRRHKEANLFPCLYCPDVFKGMGSMILHMKLHTMRRGSFWCRLCDVSYFKKVSLILHLEFHRQEGDPICKTCLLAFPTDKLYATHKQIHATPLKCDICDAQFHCIDLTQKHIKEKHSCAKLFICERCNLVLGNAEKLKQHKQNHAKEDAKNAQKFRSTARKNEVLKQVVLNGNGNAPPLKTYCLCHVCANAPLPSVINHPILRNMLSDTSQSHAARSPHTTESLPNNESYTNNFMTALVTTTLEDNVASVTNTLPISSEKISPFASDALPSVENSPETSSRNPTTFHAPNSVNHRLALKRQASATVAVTTSLDCTRPKMISSTIVPVIAKTNNAATVSSKSTPPDASLLKAFFELLVCILGHKPVQSLSLAIIADVRGFVQSFLPDLKMHGMVITIEDTIWLFIRSMVQLSGAETSELGIDHDLRHLDPRSLIEEMLRCMNSGFSNNGVIF